MSIPTPVFEQLVHAATRAPSSHNTQPWRFVRGADRVELWADRTRALAVNDPQDRELVISCGCALENLVVASRALGWAPSVEPWPLGPASDVLAYVSLAGEAVVPAPDATLEVIADRYTHRGDVAPERPDAALLSRLVQAAQSRGAAIHFLDDATRRERAAQLVEGGDRAQWDDPDWRRELARWMRPRADGEGLAMPGPIAPIARAAVRAADMGGAVAPRDRAKLVEAPCVAILATRGDDPADWLAAGRALQHVLLDAAAAGFQAAYFHQPIQVAALRPDLARLCEGASPQAMFRLGRPLSAGVRTGRRPVDEVIGAPARAQGAPC